MACVALVVCMAIGCGDEEPEDPRRVVDRSKELDAGTPMFGVYNTMKALGIPTEVGDEVQRGFFEPRGRILMVNGAPIEVYEFESKEAADEAVKKIAADGTVEGHLTLSDSPHFFRTDRVIVLYVGGDAQIINALSTAVGPQFAGLP
jgi:hypothetical protein